MELSRAEWLAFVFYALIGTVVHIFEIWFPFWRERVGIHGESVILGSYEAHVRSAHSYRLIVAAMAVFELECARPGCY